MLDTALGYGQHLVLEAATARRPHPKFLLRARIKQLFSSSFVASEELAFVVHNDAIDVFGQKRDDGAGEIDPDVLEAAFLQQYGSEALVEREGLRRRIGQILS